MHFCLSPFDNAVRHGGIDCAYRNDIDRLRWLLDDALQENACCFSGLVFSTPQSWGGSYDAFRYLLVESLRGINRLYSPSLFQTSPNISFN